MLFGQVSRTIAAKHQIVRPLAKQQCKACALVCPAIDRDRPFPVFPPIAVRAYVDAFAVERFDALYFRNLVNDAGRDHDGARVYFPVANASQKTALRTDDAVHAIMKQVDFVIPLELMAGHFQQFRRFHAVVGEEAVQCMRLRIPVDAAIAHQNPAHAPTEHQGRAQAGGTASDDKSVNLQQI